VSLRDAPAGGSLAAALAPLHREYLRRLEEMAARMPQAALLREATTRDDQGRLVLGAGDLAARYDVADARSGETFEVRSGHLDPPAASRVELGALAFELQPGCWEALIVSCRFDVPPVEEDAAALAGLLRAFGELGHHGAFSPRGAAAPWTGRIHGVQVFIGRDEVTAIYDLGTCPPASLDLLAQALDGFGRDRAPLAKILIGGQPQ
jgi:hypothetical protein